MATKLDGPLIREIVINGEPHTLRLDSAGFTITKKRARNGLSVTWAKVQHMIDLEGASER